MIKKLVEGVWQLYFNFFESCAYFLKLNGKNILIDTSIKNNGKELLEDLRSINVKPEEINLILLTHHHFDHVGNIELFKNAKVYGSKKDFPEKEFLDLNKLNLKEIEIIKTPGHTEGSVCFLMKEKGILFSGDTLFYDDLIGRTDLPNSSPEDMEKSLNKIRKIKYQTLCPGHTYRAY